MITDKVLIIAPYTYQINSGGPSGFIAHNLLDKPHDCFELSHELFEKIQNNRTLLDRLKIKPKKILSSLLKKRDYFQDKYYFHAINAHLYKNLYFHDVKSFYQFQDFISPRQTIILQSHSPELPSEEYRSYKPNDPSGYLLWKQAEEAAFKRADIIIFPHPGCIPLYENLLCKEHDIRFILSGAKSIYNESPINTEIIKSDKINLMYIGRRNAIKGFDIVLNAYRHARENRDDLNLIIVGNGEKIQ